MLFWLSKVVWFFANPATVLLLLLLAGAALSWTRWRRAGRLVVTFAAAFGLFVAVAHVGKHMIIALEDRFPIVKEPPERVDGIIALGGVVNQAVTAARGQLSLSGSAERLTEMAVLAKRFPDAKLVFTGGSGKLLGEKLSEAKVIAPLLGVLGIDGDRMIMETTSRNTWENAVNTMELIQPKDGETWLLLTSAFHMPRSVGCFRKAGWRVIPYPVDYHYRGDEEFALTFNFGPGLGSLNGGLHEWIGLAAYWLLGRTDALFPGPVVEGT